MIRTGSTQSPPAPDASALVVLLTCETIGDLPDVALLHDTIVRAEQPVRVLMLAAENTGIALARRLSATGVKVELLLGSEVADDPAELHFARMPPHTKPSDQEEFALALADVVMADPARHHHALIRRAIDLGKLVIAPGNGLPALPQSRGVTKGLDPKALARHGWRRHFAGRLEQTLVELLALFAVQEEPFRKRLKRLGKCLGLHGTWCPSSYFAPAACQAVAPDPHAFDKTSPLVARFDALDRSAVFGAYIHRDLAWVAHFGAAFAVLAAVAGATITLAGGALWAIVLCAVLELVSLMVVALLMLCIRHGHLQDRWTACRLGAEQLRIARMCLPLLVLQRALISRDTWPGRKPHAGEATDLTRDAISEVKRAIRDHGLPLLKGSGSPEHAARWVDCIVHDQIGYHEKNHQKLERAERGLRTIAAWLFFAAIAAVLADLAHRAWPCVPHISWLLLVTAAGPAFAAAFHGAATRLAIVHRISLSQDVERELRPIHEALTEIIHRPELTGESWVEIRRLAFDAAEAMGRENQSWHGQVRLQRDTLPA